MKFARTAATLLLVALMSAVSVGHAGYVDTGSISGYAPTPQTGSTSGKILVKLSDAELKESLRFLSRIAGLNIIIPEDVTGVVNVSFNNVSIMDAINSIIRANDLDYAVERGVLRIGKSGQFSKTGEDLKTETIRLKFATAKDLVENVKTLLTERGSALADERTNSIVVRERIANIESIKRFVNDVDVRDSQILIEAKIVEVTRDFSRNLGIEWGINQNANRVNVVGVQAVGLSDTNRNLNVNLPAANPTSGLGLLIGTLAGGTNIDVALTAAEQNGDAKVISDPSIVTSNGIPANIRSGETMYIKTTGDLNIGSSTSSVSSGLHEIETGIELKVTPQISEKYLVKMKINAATSQPDFSREVEGIPVVVDNTATTEVLVIDGQTTVIGGLAKFTGSNTVKAVPFFSRIPLLGNLFKSSAKQKRNTQLMIFIKPSIVKPTDYLVEYDNEVERVEEMKSELYVPPMNEKQKRRRQKKLDAESSYSKRVRNPHIIYRHNHE